MKKYLLVVLLVVFLPTLSSALDTNMELGIRGGVDTERLSEDYTVGEIYYLQTLPWQKDLCSNAKVYTRLDAGVGYIDTKSRNGGWLAVGGDVVLSMLEGAWEIDAGTRPTLLSRYEFEDDRFGGVLQFTSHIGTAVVVKNAVLSYRLQHTSNANIYKDNTGLDLHMVGLGLRF